MTQSEKEIFEHHPVYSLIEKFRIYAKDVLFEFGLDPLSGFHIEYSRNEFIMRTEIKEFVATGIKAFNYSESEREGVMYEMRPVIVMNSGTLMLLYDTLNIILSDNNIFYKVGESKELIKINSLFTKQYRFLELDIKNLPKPSLNIQRKELLERLFNNCLNFLFIHEACHIADGHLGYTNFISNSYIENRCMEFFADYYAVKRTLNDFLDIPRPHPMNGDYVGMATLYFSEYIFSLYYLMRVITSLEFTDYTPTLESNHPPIVLRWNQIVECIYNESFSDMEYEAFARKFIMPVVQGLEHAIGKTNEDENIFFWGQYDYFKQLNNMDTYRISEGRYMKILFQAEAKGLRTVSIGHLLSYGFKK